MINYVIGNFKTSILRSTVDVPSKVGCFIMWLLSLSITALSYSTFHTYIHTWCVMFLQMISTTPYYMCESNTWSSVRITLIVVCHWKDFFLNFVPMMKHCWGLIWNSTAHIQGYVLHSIYLCFVSLVSYRL